MFDQGIHMILLLDSLEEYNMDLPDKGSLHRFLTIQCYPNSIISEPSQA